MDFEGPELVIYTEEPRKFADNGDLIKNLAKELRKRLVVRPDPKVLEQPEEAITAISKIVPPESGISNHYFDVDTGEVIIEAEKPRAGNWKARRDPEGNHESHRLDSKSS